MRSFRRFYPVEGGIREPRWMILYTVTLGVQGFCGLLRYKLALIFVPFLWSFGPPIPIAGLLCLLIGFGPVAFSVISLAYPVGAGSYWRTQIGGREPSDRESALYENALFNLRDCDPGMRVPKHWFVLDVPQIAGAVLGDTLMLSTATLYGKALYPVLAHELGHLNTIDANLTVALNRIALPAKLFVRADRALGDGILVTIFILTAWIVSGELALGLTGPLWDAWFRSREFKADEYAGWLAQAPALAAVLQSEALTSDRPIPFRFLSDASHPYTEHRIQALLNYDVVQRQRELLTDPNASRATAE